MSGPPGDSSTPDRNLTDLRPTKRDRRAEANRHRTTRTPAHRRVHAAMVAAGITPEPWQVESLVTALLARRNAATDDALVEELMRAPWFPRARRRPWKIGELGWRTST